VGGDIFNGNGGSPHDVMLIIRGGRIDVFRRSYEEDWILINHRPVKIEPPGRGPKTCGWCVASRNSERASNL